MEEWQDGRMEERKYGMALLGFRKIAAKSVAAIVASAHAHSSSAQSVRKDGRVGTEVWNGPSRLPYSRSPKSPSHGRASAL